MTAVQQKIERLIASCSWCGVENDVTLARQLLPVFCRECGHRADVPRVSCDCDECLLNRRNPADLSQSFLASERVVG